MDRLPDHVKGLLITGAGVLLLTPDTLLVRLIAIDPWTMIFWRGALVMLGLVAYLAWSDGRRVLARFRTDRGSTLAVALLFTVSAVLFILALDMTSVANTLIIVASSPLFAAIFGRIFLGEAVPTRTWAAIGATLGGIGVVVSGSLGGGTLPGDLAALGTAVCLAASLSLLRRTRARNMVPAMALSGLMSAVIALPLAAPFAMDMTQAGLMLLLGLIILPISFCLIMLGPRYLPAPEVGLIMLLETVLGPLWVWLVLGEAANARALLGGGIVIATLIVHSALAMRRSANG